MHEQRNWTVEVRLAYDVSANSAEQALGAVLPLLSLGPDRYGPQPRIADYTVREISEKVQPQTAATVDSLHGLTKAVYTAKEVAEILKVSVHTVYSRVPSMAIGSARRFTRSTVLDVLEHGIERNTESQQPIRVTYDRPMRIQQPTKIVQPKREKPQRPFLTVREAAKLLRISTYKMRQLIDAKKVFYFEDYGKKSISREALEHYLAGLTPRAFAEKRIAEAKEDPTWKGDLASLEQIAQEWRARWPE